MPPTEIVHLLPEGTIQVIQGVMWKEHHQVRRTAEDKREFMKGIRHGILSQPFGQQCLEYVARSEPVEICVGANQSYQFRRALAPSRRVRRQGAACRLATSALLRAARRGFPKIQVGRDRRFVDASQTALRSGAMDFAIVTGETRSSSLPRGGGSRCHRAGRAGCDAARTAPSTLSAGFAALNR